MAVTQGLGDGYALYNGVKLPNIESVWTDKESQPNALIVKLSSGTVFMFTCYDVSDIFYNETVTTPDYYFTVYAPFNMYQLSNGAWKLSQTQTTDSYFKVSTFVPLWSTVDIANADSTTYLSTTDPIPLDGMNVIEWDGDATDLTAHASKANYYAVATGSVDATTAQAVLSDGTTSADGYLSDGGNIYLYSDGTTYTSLLAYTEAVAPEWVFNLKDFLSGSATAAASRGVLPKRKIVGYSYNGVVLPDIESVWDKGAEPYAYINSGVDWLLTANAPFVVTLYEDGRYFLTTTDDCHVSVYKLSNSAWNLLTYYDYPSEHTFLNAQTIVWCSHDIKSTDGTTYLKASEPVPVYGGDN